MAVTAGCGAPGGQCYAVPARGGGRAWAPVSRILVSYGAARPRPAESAMGPQVGAYDLPPPRVVPVRKGRVAGVFQDYVEHAAQFSHGCYLRRFSCGIRISGSWVSDQPSPARRTPAKMPASAIAACRANAADSVA